MLGDTFVVVAGLKVVVAFCSFALELVESVVVDGSVVVTVVNGTPDLRTDVLVFIVAVVKRLTTTKSRLIISHKHAALTK